MARIPVVRRLGCRHVNCVLVLVSGGGSWHSGCACSSRGQLRIRAKSAHKLDDCGIGARSIAVMMRPEKGAPERRYGACSLKDLAGRGRVSEKEFLSGRKRAAAKPRPGTRTALYMRVSTADQKPDLQDDDLRGYAARAGLDVVQDYCDVAVSGRREGRPQLNALMAAARNHEIDCVLVWKFDRFARSTRHLLTALEEFDHLGVRFVSVQDQIDTDSPMGRAMFTIIGAMAELESSLISERVTAGMR